MTEEDFRYLEDFVSKFTKRPRTAEELTPYRLPELFVFPSKLKKEKKVKTTLENQYLSFFEDK